MACACLVRPAESDLDTHPHILRHPGRSNVLVTDRRQCHGIRRLGQFACMLAYVKEQVLLPTCIEDSPEESTDSNWEVNKHQALNVQGRWTTTKRSFTFCTFAHVTVDDIWPRL